MYQTVPHLALSGALAIVGISLGPIGVAAVCFFLGVRDTDRGKPYPVMFTGSATRDLPVTLVTVFAVVALLTSQVERTTLLALYEQICQFVGLGTRWLATYGDNRAGTVPPHGWMHNVAGIVCAAVLVPAYLNGAVRNRGLRFPNSGTAGYGTRFLFACLFLAVLFVTSYSPVSERSGRIRGIFLAAISPSALMLTSVWAGALFAAATGPHRTEQG